MTDSNFGKYMLSSTILNAVADIGKYSSLLYGIVNVIGDEPHMDKAIGAGAAYFVSGVIGHVARGMGTDASIESVEKRFDNLEKKFEK